MELLPFEIKKNGFIYKQINRTENAAMYSQNIENDEIPVAYEVFQIRQQKESVSKMGGVDIVFKAKELFPSDEQFGLTAWSFIDKRKAEARFKGIC
jgi:hypothetical protein